MRINEEAVSFSAFSLTEILVAELLRKGVLDREAFISAVRKEIDEQRRSEIRQLKMRQRC